MAAGASEHALSHAAKPLIVADGLGAEVDDECGAVTRRRYPLMALETCLRGVVVGYFGMSWRDWFPWFKSRSHTPEHLRRGALGEQVAREYLEAAGLSFLTANFRSSGGEIDLVFKDGPCLVFVEVKTRSSEQWARPAAAVNAEKKRRLSRAALDYLREIRNPAVAFRFDIVEVLLESGEVYEIRHLPHAFVLSKPYRYG